MMRGRPLRFMALLVTGWLAARSAMLWSDPAPAPAARDDFIPFALSRLDRQSPAIADGFLPHALTRWLEPPEMTAAFPRAPVRAGGRPPRALATASMTDARILALFGLRHYIEVPVADATEATPSPMAAAPLPAVAPGIGPLPRTLPSRWRLSGWLMIRPGGGDPGSVPLLGASQAGARASYAIDAGRRLAVFARAAAPLGGGDGEGALGIEWRPAEAPVAAYAELRQRAAGLAVAAGLYGGVAKDMGSFRLDGYGQAGLVAGRSGTGFVEGQVRGTRPISAAVDAGIGAWGAAQRGAARLDIGPTLGLALPLRHGGARLTLDWRQRIAGDARPNSGLALSLGTDF